MDYGKDCGGPAYPESERDQSGRRESRAPGNKSQGQGGFAPEIVQQGSDIRQGCPPEEKPHPTGCWRVMPTGEAEVRCGATPLQHSRLPAIENLYVGPAAMFHRAGIFIKLLYQSAGKFEGEECRLRHLCPG
jgi:hypothetical protein